MFDWVLNTPLNQFASKYLVSKYGVTSGPYFAVFSPKT